MLKLKSNIIFRILLSVILLIFLYPAKARAGVFDNIGSNTIDSFTGDNLLYNLTGIASTYLLVSSNADASLSQYFNKHNDQYYYEALPGAAWGTLSPIVIGGGLYLFGSSSNDKETLGAAYAVLQASLINITCDSLLKAITGRPNPNPDNGDLESQSRVFKIGFLEGGIFHGWPSGHVSATAAVAFSLIHYYPDSLLVKIYGYTSVAYMMFTVTAFSGGRMHWFSDGVAGLLMGYTIGKTVGDSYRNEGMKTSEKDTIKYFSFFPLVSDEAVGGQLTIIF
jgi:membrane-associated phospholipid phosphatase